MIIDSHVHFWKFDKKRDAWITDQMKILKQDYLPAHLIPTLKRNDVDGCVAVQAAQLELETHFLLELAKTIPQIKAVVGWIDLRDERIDERLDYFSQYPLIKGWRHILRAETDDFFADKKFRHGIAAIGKLNYTFDLLINPRQLKPALELIDAFPEVKFIIDHCAKPEIQKKEITEWSSLIKEAANFPNTCCKLSGLFTEAKWKEWSPADFYPYLDVVFNAFGNDRLLYGSDWPVILLSGIYVQWKSLLEKYMESFSEEDRLKVFGANAVTFYNL
jgi:L-fuconolactonase